MSWSAATAMVDQDVLAEFGEDVTLPSAVVVTGVFDPRGAQAAPWGSEVGLVGRVSQQPNPVVHLTDGDAAGLADGAQLQIRGTAYVVVRLDPDGAGMVRCELMPAAAASDNAQAVWR